MSTVSVKMKNILSVVIISLLVTCTMSTNAFAMSDGAYTVSRNVYYGNPETNEQLDNSALGQSMAESVLNSTVLVEQVNGTYYVTMGIGLSSNVSNIRAYAQSSKGGSYSKVSITKTGSNEQDGDTCTHYRFKTSSVSNYFKVQLYVGPMGRDVEFYFSLNMSSAKAGSGQFTSEMIPVATEAPKATEKVTATEKPAATKAPSKTAAASTAAPEKTESAKATKAPAATKAPTAAESTEATASPQQTEAAVTEETEVTKATATPETTASPVAEEVTEEAEASEENEEAEESETEETADNEEVVDDEKNAEIDVETQSSKADYVVIIGGFALFILSCGYGYILIKQQKEQ